MIRLIARRDFAIPFRGVTRRVCAGEAFETDPVEASALVNYHGVARFATHAEQATGDVDTPPRRRYRRRDLRAEE